MTEEPGILDQLLPMQFIDGTNLAASLTVSRSLSIGRGQVAAFLYQPKTTYTLSRQVLQKVSSGYQVSAARCAVNCGRCKSMMVRAECDLKPRQKWEEIL